MAAAPKVLTVNELADYLRVHRSTIYRLLKKGQLPGFKIGSDWRFNVEVIDEWRLKQGAGLLGCGPNRDDRLQTGDAFLIAFAQFQARRRVSAKLVKRTRPSLDDASA